MIGVLRGAGGEFSRVISFPVVWTKNIYVCSIMGDLEVRIALIENKQKATQRAVRDTQITFPVFSWNSHSSIWYNMAMLSLGRRHARYTYLKPSITDILRCHWNKMNFSAALRSRSIRYSIVYSYIGKTQRRMRKWNQFRWFYFLFSRMAIEKSCIGTKAIREVHLN